MLAPLAPCPTCHAPLRAGTPARRCPSCLIGISLTAAATSARRPLASLAELAAAFPDLTDLRPLGAGGMGVVFRARQRDLDRDVALKVVPAGGSSDDPAFDERFLRESRALARLQHPRIVSVFAAGRAGRLLYILMELVEGVSLRDLLADGPLSPAEAMRVAGQLCEGLAYAHGRGVIHRDVKPENILLDAIGDVKVIDFGIARLIDDAVAPDLNLTGPADRLGTARYMAPEQAASAAARTGQPQGDQRTDVYAVGVVLYEMLAGAPPAAGYVPASERAPVSRRVDAVIGRCLAERPADRFPTVREVGRALAEAVEPPRRLWRKHIGAAAVLGGGAASLALLAIALSRDFGGGRRGVPAAATPVGQGPPSITAAAAQFPLGSPADVLTSADWTWTAPRNLGPIVNTEHVECQPCLAADGRTLVFESNRPGGFGHHDLWMTSRATADGEWSAPANLGPNVNSAAMELNPCLSADGMTLLFCRNPPGVPVPDAGNAPSGGEARAIRGAVYQLWTATRLPPTAAVPDPAWTVAQPIDVGIADPACPSLSADGLTLYFSAGTNGSGGPVGNLYRVRRTTADEPWQAPQRLSTPDADPSPSPRDPLITADDRVLIWSTGTSRGDGQRPFEFRMAVRPSPAAPFGAPQSVGRTLHANAEDISMALSADAHTLVFDSNRPGGQGAHDLWIAHRVRR